ncbi:MAG: hypothetical protein ABEJ35_08025 [Halobacteriaceae archaeon]
MDIEQLRAVQTRERSSSDLQDLRDSFYADVAEYLDELRTERDRLAAECDDPYDDSVIRVNDEIKTAERVVESIYERRVGKVVEQACLAADKDRTPPSGLTAEERSLFEDLVARIETNSERVLGVLTGESDIESTLPSATTEDDGTASSSGPDTAEPAVSETATEPDPHQPEDERTEEGDEDQVGAADLMAGGVTDGGPAGSAVSDSPDGDATSPQDSVDPGPEDTGTATAAAGDAESALAERTLLRVTADVGEVFGIDGQVYDLKAGDVVTLPAENAEPLLRQDAATRLD